MPTEVKRKANCDLTALMQSSQLFKDDLSRAMQHAPIIHANQVDGLIAHLARLCVTIHEQISILAQTPSQQHQQQQPATDNATPGQIGPKTQQ